MLGFNATKKEVSQLWEENAKKWNSDGLSPWRPSPGDLSLYEKLGASKLRGHILILGATPELRDIVSKHNRKYFIADISPAMIFRMTSFLKHADPSKEIWIKSDWLEMPLSDNYFDLIISDMPWWVISVEDQEKLCSKLASLLQNNGLIVTRAHFRNPYGNSEDGAQIIQRYLKKMDDYPEKYHTVGREMVSYLQDFTASAEDMKINRAKTKIIILQAIADSGNPIHRKFLEEFSERLSPADWTSQTREELLSILEKKFSIVAEENAADYESKCYPIMALKKNA